MKKITFEKKMTNLYRLCSENTSIIDRILEEEKKRICTESIKTNPISFLLKDEKAICKDPESEYNNVRSNSYNFGGNLKNNQISNINKKKNDINHRNSLQGRVNLEEEKKTIFKNAGIMDLNPLNKIYKQNKTESHQLRNKKNLS